MTRLIPLLLVGYLELACAGERSVVDDLGRSVRLPAEPERIVSLAPHLTEILFSLGVGDRIVATVEYSDYPPAAERIPRLGDAFSLSIEAIVNQSPDLVVAWSTGGNHRTLLQLKELGYAVYQNEAADLDAIAGTVEKLGLLVGREAEGRAQAKAFRDSLASIAADHADRESPTRVFFQISDNQLYTVNDEHLIGQALRICGAENVFGSLTIPVPMVSLESVLDADPQVILVASPHKNFKSRWLAEWQRLGWQGRLSYIDASLITRPGLRMLSGIEFMCETINSAVDQ